MIQTLNHGFWNMVTDIAPIADVLDAARSAEEAGHWDDALSMYQTALDRWQSDGGAPVCELLRKIGLVHYFRGDFEVALNLFESSRRIASENGFTAQVANATNCLGIARQALGQLELAEQLYSRAATLADLVGDERLAVLT